MAAKKTAVAKRSTTAKPRTRHHYPAKHRSAPVRRRATRHGSGRGMAAGLPRPRANGIMTIVQETAGGSSAAAILHFVPKPSFLGTMPTALYQGLVCIGGSFVSNKFLKMKEIAAGMNGAAGYILASAAFNGTMMNDPNFDLADTEIIDAEDLQALEALEEDDDDVNQSFMSEDGREVMLCDDGEYRYVHDGALYQE